MQVLTGTAKNPAGRLTTRPGALAGRVAFCSRAMMPLVKNTGNVSGETYRAGWTCQNNCVNPVFEWPGFGYYDGGTFYNQYNEAPWPWPYAIEASIEVPILQNLVVSSEAANVVTVTPAPSPSWGVSEWVSKFSQLNGLWQTLTTTGTLATGATLITLTAATQVLIKQGVILLFQSATNSGYARVAQDVPVGSLTIPCAPLSYGITTGATCSTGTAGGILQTPHPMLELRAVGGPIPACAPIVANAAGTLTTAHGMGLDGLASGDVVSIIARYPVTFKGSYLGSYDPNVGGNIVSDPVYGLKLVAGQEYQFQLKPTMPIGSGNAQCFFPAINPNLGQYPEDIVCPNDCVMSGRGSGGTGARTPFPFLAHADPSLDSTTNKVVGAISDSKTYGATEYVGNPYWSWLGRAINSVGNMAIVNLSCNGEVVHDMVGFHEARAAQRIRALQLCDTVWTQLGTNDIGQAAPASGILADLVLMGNILVRNGIVDRPICTIGPFTAASLGIAPYFPGNESLQLVTNGAALLSLDTSIAACPAPFTRVFDWRATAQLGGLGGTAGKWQTFSTPVQASRAITVNGGASTLIDTAAAGLNASNNLAPFPQAWNNQGSTQTITGVTSANPAVFTVASTANYVTGATFTFNQLAGDPGWTALNGTTQAITVINGTTFQMTTTLNAGTFAAYTASSGRMDGPAGFNGLTRGSVIGQTNGTGPQAQYQGCGILLTHTAGDSATGATVTAMSKASPTVCTVSSTKTLLSGGSVTIASATGGAGWAAGVNGTFTITVIDASTFSIPVDSTGFTGTYNASSGNVIPAVEYNYVSQGSILNSSGTLQTGLPWLVIPTFNGGVNSDTYVMYEIPTIDGTHPTPAMYKRLAAAAVTLGVAA